MKKFQNSNEKVIFLSTLMDIFSKKKKVDQKKKLLASSPGLVDRAVDSSKSALSLITSEINKRKFFLLSIETLSIKPAVSSAN